MIYMNKSPEALEGFFGVIESGCFYVPLDEEMPKRRIELIIENTKARVIVCDFLLMEKLCCMRNWQRKERTRKSWIR